VLKKIQCIFNTETTWWF